MDRYGKENEKVELYRLLSVSNEKVSKLLFDASEIIPFGSLGPEVDRVGIFYFTVENHELSFDKNIPDAGYFPVHRGACYTLKTALAWLIVVQMSTKQVFSGFNENQFVVDLVADWMTMDEQQQEIGKRATVPSCGITAYLSRIDDAERGPFLDHCKAMVKDSGDLHDSTLEGQRLFIQNRSSGSIGGVEMYCLIALAGRLFGVKCCIALLNGLSRHGRTCSDTALCVLAAVLFVVWIHTRRTENDDSFIVLTEDFQHQPRCILPDCLEFNGEESHLLECIADMTTLIATLLWELTHARSLCHRCRVDFQNRLIAVTHTNGAIAFEVIGTVTGELLMRRDFWKGVMPHCRMHSADKSKGYHTPSALALIIELDRVIQGVVDNILLMRTFILSTPDKSADWRQRHIDHLNQSLYGPILRRCSDRRHFS
jgi:hypothetical protein